MAGFQSIKTAVVAPVFNEPDTWLSIATELTQYFDLVVVVDDGSAQALHCPKVDGVVIVRHDKNMGKGAALRSGFQYCLDQNAMLIGTIDTDGEHDPRNFISALGQYRGEDMVALSRAPFFGRYSKQRRFRNELISKILAHRTGVPFEDTQTGMRLFSAAAVEACLDVDMPKGYAVETIMLETISAQKMLMSELPMQHEGVIRNGKKYCDIGVFWTVFQTFFSRFVMGARAGRSTDRTELDHLMTRQNPQTYSAKSVTQQ